MTLRRLPDEGAGSSTRASLPFYQTRPHGLYGVGIDAVSALDAWGLGFPGFDGPGARRRARPGMNRDAIRGEEAEQLLLPLPRRQRHGRAAPRAPPRSRGDAGRTADDVVTARADYGAARRCREARCGCASNSTVVRVQHAGRPRARPTRWRSPTSAEARLHKVRAKSCVLACWNVVIPHLCPELPDDAEGGPRLRGEGAARLHERPRPQLDGLREARRLAAPRAPAATTTRLRLDVPVSLGDYHFPRDPEEPIVVNLSKVPCAPGPRGARPAPGGAAGAARHAVREHRAQDPRPDGAGAGRAAASIPPATSTPSP